MKIAITQSNVTTQGATNVSGAMVMDTLAARGMSDVKALPSGKPSATQVKAPVSANEGVRNFIF